MNESRQCSKGTGQSSYHYPIRHQVMKAKDTQASKESLFISEDRETCCPQKLNEKEHYLLKLF